MVEVEGQRHNHLTRVIERVGVCPKCDVLHHGVSSPSKVYYWYCPSCGETDVTEVRSRPGHEFICDDCDCVMVLVPEGWKR